MPSNRRERSYRHSWPLVGQAGSAISQPSWGGPRLHREASLCYPEYAEPEILRGEMRSPLVRCLVLLLSLALANGNAHASLRLDAAHSVPCPEEHAHHDGHTSPDHQHQPEKRFGCCCDCLSCSSAAQVSPSLDATPVEFASQIHFDASTASLSSRAVPPEPDPPRPGTRS
jgi:hypothetical protein